MFKRRFFNRKRKGFLRKFFSKLREKREKGTKQQKSTKRDKNVWYKRWRKKIHFPPGTPVSVKDKVKKTYSTKKDGTSSNSVDAGMGGGYEVKPLPHKVRSPFETEVFMLLQQWDIPYLYEGRLNTNDDAVKFFEKYDDKWHVYVPDGIVYGHKILEIKGYTSLRRKKLEKMKAFYEQYPYEFIIVGGSKREDICDIHIPWQNREKLLGTLQNIRDQLF